VTELGEDVIDRDSGGYIGTFPDPMLDRVDKGDGPDEMRSDRLTEKTPFTQRFPNKLEVELLKVSEPPVDELR
jgi:hypothetical protein